MLIQSSDFVKRTQPEKAIILKLASEFQSRTSHLFLDPEELTLHTELGDKEQWTDFLNMSETQSYIKGQMSFLGTIAQRKTFASLVEEALRGNQSAAKQVQELSGIMNKQDNNRTIILHHVPRPITPVDTIINSGA